MAELSKISTTLFRIMAIFLVLPVALIGDSAACFEKENECVAAFDSDLSLTLQGRLLEKHNQYSQEYELPTIRESPNKNSEWYYANSGHILTFDSNGNRIPNNIQFGRSYTVVVKDSVLYVGDQIPGKNDVNHAPGGSGSHLTLLQYANDDFDYFECGGAIRFNLSGTIDVSGYHLSLKSQRAADKIKAFLEAELPGANVRTTPDRLKFLEPD